jgi:pilus assembly protein CpaF
VGLGPIEPLLKDDSINDILINGPFQIYVERRGELELTPIRFRDNDHLLRIVNRIVAGVGRRIDESQPMVDARLADGSRVNAAIAPIAIDGACVSIRKFSKKPLTLEKLVEFGAMPMAVADFLHGAVKARVSTVISGGTGSGKTTLLNALSAAISQGERVITIEDAAELQLQQPHVVRMETRPPNIEGKGEIRQRELVKNALRMRPDRVILGEVRSEEAFDMLQAMNTGHEGSMATIHANNPREAIGRLEQMIAMGGLSLSPDAMRGQIASAIGMVVQVMRLSDGKRKVTHVTEIVGMEGQVVQMQDIFTFNRTHTGPDGAVHGEFRASGLRPRCLEEMTRRGIPYDVANFDPSRVLG